MAAGSELCSAELLLAGTANALCFVGGGFCVGFVFKYTLFFFFFSPCLFWREK